MHSLRGDGGSSIRKCSAVHDALPNLVRGKGVLREVVCLAFDVELEPGDALGSFKVHVHDHAEGC